MTYKVTARFSKPANKQWMMSANPTLRAEIDSAINSLSDFPGFISRTVDFSVTELIITTECTDETAYTAYFTAKEAAISHLQSSRLAHLAANDIVELESVVQNT